MRQQSENFHLTSFESTCDWTYDCNGDEWMKQFEYTLNGISFIKVKMLVCSFVCLYVNWLSCIFSSGPKTSLAVVVFLLLFPLFSFFYVDCFIP